MKTRPQNVNCINPGFNTSGRRKWKATTSAMGQIAVKSLICQSCGTKCPSGPTPARTIMAKTIRKQKRKVNLKRRRIVGTSSKKDVRVASLAVAPQLMLMDSMWQAMACDTWMEMPPRKIVSKGSQVRFSMKEPMRERPATRCEDC